MTISNLYPDTYPSLLLDFANVRGLDPRVTFTRASGARYYDGVTVAKAEENLLLRSQEFDDVYWTKTTSTITANSTTAPDGTSTADTLVSTSAAYIIVRSVDVIAATYVLSVFAKANTDTFLILRETFGIGTGASTWFNLSNGTIGTTNANHTASIQSVGNGWYRCIIVLTTNAARNGQVTIYGATSDNSFSTTIGNSIFVWGAQLEQRDSVTAYTPTTTQPITNYVPQLLSAANNVARFDHNPITGESLGLLIEEQRTNLLVQSEDFSTTWTATRASVTTNTVIAPDGTLTADKLIDDNTASNSHFINQTFTVSANTTYAITCYAKAGEGNRFLRLASSGASNWLLGYAARFDLVNGVIFSTTTGTASITAIGNGWYRCSLLLTTVASPPGGAGVLIQMTDTTGATNYTGDGYSGIYIWGAQLEAGAFATSYIPTVASQVTRSADAASMTGTNFSSWYRADHEGSVYVESNEFGGIRSGPFWLTSASGRGIGYQRPSTANLEMFYREPAGPQRTVVLANAIPLLQTHKVATSFNSTDTSVSVNSVSAVSNSGVALFPIIDQLRLGTTRLGGSEPFIWCGHIKKLSYYPQRLTNTQLQALTN
jgi:hypothetical protein